MLSKGLFTLDAMLAFTFLILSVTLFYFPSMRKNCEDVSYFLLYLKEKNVYGWQGIVDEFESLNVKYSAHLYCKYLKSGITFDKEKTTNANYMHFSGIVFYNPSLDAVCFLKGGIGK